MRVFVFCSGSLKYCGVSPSWNFVEKNVNCSGVCSSYLNLLEKPFFIFRGELFCLRSGPFANSSAVEKEPQQYLLKHLSKK